MLGMAVSSCTSAQRLCHLSGKPACVIDGRLVMRGRLRPYQGFKASDYLRFGCMRQAEQCRQTFSRYMELISRINESGTPRKQVGLLGAIWWVLHTFTSISDRLGGK